MNRLLYVARKAKGLSVQQLAKLLGIAQEEYTKLEHSLTDIKAEQALKLCKLYGIEPEHFMYDDGRGQRLINHEMGEVNQIVHDLKPDGMPQPLYLRLVSLGNTALSLQSQLAHATYQLHELEQDNRALRQLNEALQAKIEQS